MDNKFTFDDILLVPGYAEQDVREFENATAAKLFDYAVSVPIISSPMDTITENVMMDTLRRNGALGCHHRYCDWNTLVQATILQGGIAISPSMGIGKVVQLWEKNKFNFFVVDVAHGHTEKVISFCQRLLDKGITNIVSGNIVTKYAVEEYLKIGIKHLRVGVGGGSRCLTRVVTGFGYPQASAVKELYDEFKDDIVIISDGGCKNTGDVIKAFSLGASFVMTGYLFAGTDECPPLGQGMYRGMASKDALEGRKAEYFVEGDTISVSPKGKAKNIIETIKDAIKHACHYGGVINYKELVEVDKIRITENSYLEGMSRK